MPDLRKMKMCYAYSNLSPREKWLWSEYKRIRADWKFQSEVLEGIPEEKPRLHWDYTESRWRPSHQVTRKDIIRKEVHRLGYRLLELALYLYKAGYIAPDFTQEELQNN